MTLAAAEQTGMVTRINRKYSAVHLNEICQTFPNMKGNIRQFTHRRSRFFHVTLFKVVSGSPWQQLIRKKKKEIESNLHAE